MTLRAILCHPLIRFARHRPRRVLTALGSVAVCDDCGTSALTVLDLMSDDGFVDPERRTFERDARYVSAQARSAA